MSNQNTTAGGKDRNQDTPASSKARNLSGDWRSKAAAPSSNPATPTPKEQPSPPINNSSNYRGDLNNPRNRSANIPDGENCATWWTNLPADCTYQMLFDSLRSIGAISHAVINPPVGIHGTSAAKIEFFERASVDRLLAQASNGHIRGHMRVGGRIPHILMNRIRVAATSNVVDSNMGNGGRGSRVLQVIGDPSIIRQDRLEKILASPPNKVVYGLERARSFTRNDGSHCVEFRFASYLVQAVRARDAFMAQAKRGSLPEEERALWENVVCQFGPDPCE
ncbi:hypothetical protein F5Y14DRAFT_447820 [Nemania sp. NC0429]|nr:hypothetical protein F5Y14DRAFT_447820 [Nemania sp. NC0429]